MKRTSSLLIGLVLFVLLACGPLDDPAQSTVSITPNLKYSTCITNYTRRFPNFCQANSSSLEQWTVTISGSTIHVLTSPPSSAVLVELKVQSQIFSSNVVNLKTVSAQQCSTQSCVTTAGSHDAIIREFVATVAGTQIYQTDFTIRTPIIVVASSPSIVSKEVFINAANGSNITYFVMGYYD